MTARLLLALLLGLSSCARLSGYTDAGAETVVRQYPDGQDGLKSLFADVLEAARRDEREKVHALLSSLMLTDDELKTLFGDDSSIRGRYHAMMETLVNRGGVELVAQVYERKLDDVSVVPVDLAAKTASPEEHAVAVALRQPITSYSVRIKKKSDDRGLRYDLFFYFNGHWRTGNQLGKFLAPVPPPASAATKPTVPGPATSAAKPTASGPSTPATKASAAGIVPATPSHSSATGPASNAGVGKTN